jgi:hypothetical protein
MTVVPRMRRRVHGTPLARGQASVPSIRSVEPGLDGHTPGCTKFARFDTFTVGAWHALGPRPSRRPQLPTSVWHALGSKPGRRPQHTGETIHDDDSMRGDYDYDYDKGKTSKDVTKGKPASVEKTCS